MVIVALYTLRCVAVCIQAPNNQNTLIVQSIPPKDLKEEEIYFHHCHQALNLLL